MSAFGGEFSTDDIEDFTTDLHSVLDFGSGTGANCCICDPGHYLGIEPDAKRVALAQRLYPEHRFSHFDQKQVPADDESVDYVLVIAVLHHLQDEQIQSYLSEFERVLKRGGKIIVMEPYLLDGSRVRNSLMRWYDDGDHIRDEDSYLRLFHSERFDCQVVRKFSKCLVYNEIFFAATPKK
ncbi:class I SAM-dependent methyltransferase [Cohnella kolymensis]|uniref:class I SAM-dependent methyltransferase n=1 Tax=Cohnella kolymensis TaxID=1590652 RepID=UPI000698D82D|nr:class I SAM-dependent methyltransferase [Cohnella kolymensis]